MSKRVTRFNALPVAERERLLATGRVTAQKFIQLVDGEFVTFYMPKVRGFAIKTIDGWRFDTAAEAIAAGKSSLAARRPTETT